MGKQTMNASRATSYPVTQNIASMEQGHEFMSPQVLRRQNRQFHSTGGVSQENRSSGFLPAFLDSSTGAVYLSRFADGRIAPMHLLDGLPSEVVRKRTTSGRITAVCDTMIAGFIRDNQFYTRDEAASIVSA